MGLVWQTTISILSQDGRDDGDDGDDANAADDADDMDMNMAGRRKDAAVKDVTAAKVKDLVVTAATAAAAGGKVGATPQGVVVAR